MVLSRTYALNTNVCIERANKSKKWVNEMLIWKRILSEFSTIWKLNFLNNLQYHILYVQVLAGAYYAKEGNSFHMALVVLKTSSILFLRINQYFLSNKFAIWYTLTIELFGHLKFIEVFLVHVFWLIYSWITATGWEYEMKGIPWDMPIATNNLYPTTILQDKNIQQITVKTSQRITTRYQISQYCRW